LYVYGEGLFTEMRLKNDGEAWSDWMPFDATVDWTLKNMAGLRGVETELKIGSYVITSIDYIYLDIEAVPAVELKMKAVLQGPYAANMGLMTSYLNEQQLLPLNQPYSGAPYFYNGTESVANMTVIPTNVVDWVLVQARSANNVSEVVEQKAAFLLNNGNVVDVNGATNGVQFFNLNENTDYYIGLVHRNHIAVISSAVVNLPNAMTYDFSESANKAMGNEQQVLVSGNVYALIAGDVQADGMIQYADFNAYLQGVAFNGYHNADCNLNGMVSQDDFDLWQPNTSKIGLSIVRY
jgi:hypothetical protein